MESGGLMGTFAPEQYKETLIFLATAGVVVGKVIASIHEKRDEFRKILQPIAGRVEARQAIKMSVRMREINKRQPKSKTDE
jgi:monovalent cation:H+ antiporter-2, CPA2 family